MTPVAIIGRFKVCPPKLDRVIKWANLAGDHDLPNRLPSGPIPPLSGNTLASLMQGLDQLPAEIRSHLHELMNRQEEWAETPAEARKEYRSRSKEHEVWAKQINFRFPLQFAAVYRRYKLILAARETLRAIVDDKLREWPTTAFMKRGDDGKGKYAGDPIADALLDAEIDYIKRCPICRVFFYAGRNNIDEFPPDCAKVARERERKIRRRQEETQNSAIKRRKGK